MTADDPWKRLAGAAKSSGAKETAPKAGEPGWWPELQRRVGPVFMRLLWRRWALAAAAIAAALALASAWLLDENHESNPPDTPTLPIPPVP